MTRIGEKLRRLRQLSGLTTQEVADNLKTSRAYITQIEQGQRSPSGHLILRMSRFFNVSADVLIKDELELDT